jgi:hypothetical protein
MVGGTGIEPVTPCVSSKCSTAELTALLLRSTEQKAEIARFIKNFLDLGRENIFNLTNQFIQMKRFRKDFGVQGL